MAKNTPRVQIAHMNEALKLMSPTSELFITLLAGPQVNDRCPWGYLIIRYANHEGANQSGRLRNWISAQIFFDVSGRYVFSRRGFIDSREKWLLKDPLDSLFDLSCDMTSLSTVGPLDYSIFWVSKDLRL